MFLGVTGSGKSVDAGHLLAFQNWHLMPWIIFDYKEDELITKICKVVGAKRIKPSASLPTEPGIYRCIPTPVIDDDIVEEMLWRIHAHGNIGIFVDEGYMISNSAFDTILVQGRSKHIPVIALYQRPVWMSRFAIAQADFVCCHFQNDGRDIKTTREFMPPALADDGKIYPIDTHLPKYYSMWYTVGERYSRIKPPCPTPAQVLELFAKRVGKSKQSDDPRKLKVI